MAFISKPTLTVMVLVVAGGLLFHFQEGSAPEKTILKTVHKSSTTKEAIPTDLVKADFTTRFPRTKLKMRNLFAAPLIKSVKLSVGGKALNFKVPAMMADGDPGWIFTGIAVVDGKKMALLESDSSHQAAYVSEGDRWKATFVVRITSDGVALRPKDGGPELVVLRYNAQAEASAGSNSALTVLPPAKGLAPVMPQSLRGPIGDTNLSVNSIASEPSGAVVITETP